MSIDLHSNPVFSLLKPIFGWIIPTQQFQKHPIWVHFGHRNRFLGLYSTDFQLVINILKIRKL